MRYLIAPITAFSYCAAEVRSEIHEKFQDLLIGKQLRRCAFNTGHTKVNQFSLKGRPNSLLILELLLHPSSAQS